MKRCIFVLGFLMLCSLTASAQGPMGVGASFDTNSNPAGFSSSSFLSPWRFAFGYQYNRINLTGTPFTTTGVNLSVSRNLWRWFGMEGQAGFGFGNPGSTTVPSNLTAKSVLVAGGPRLVHRGPTSRIDLWIHGLAGMEHFRFSQTAGELGSNTGLAGVGGGGLDVRINRNLILTGEADAMSTRLDGRYQRHFQAIGSLAFRY